jgi:hypothetical protein
MRKVPDHPQYKASSPKSVTIRNCNLINPKKVTQKINSVINNSEATFHEAEQAWTMLMPYLWKDAVVKNRYSRNHIRLDNKIQS